MWRVEPLPLEFVGWYTLSKRVFPRPAAASISPGNFLEINTLKSHKSETTESETLGVGPSTLCFNKLFWEILRTTGLMKSVL